MGVEGLDTAGVEGFGTSGVAGGVGVEGLGTAGVGGLGRSRTATTLAPGPGRGAAKVLVKAAKAARNPKVRMLVNWVVWKV